jgi:hypothetical protein
MSFAMLAAFSVVTSAQKDDRKPPKNPPVINPQPKPSPKPDKPKKPDSFSVVWKNNTGDMV